MRRLSQAPGKFWVGGLAVSLSNTPALHSRRLHQAESEGFIKDLLIKLWTGMGQLPSGSKSGGSPATIPSLEQGGRQK